MTSINMMGAYSGIDMSVIDQLVAAEKAKGAKFTNQKAKIEKEQSAWKDVNSRLDNLHKKLDALTKTETFQTRTVTSNIKESPYLTITAGDKAAVGQYRVHVSQLAASSQLTGQEIDIDSIYTDLDVSGTFSFAVQANTRDENGHIVAADSITYPEENTINIETTDSLKDIADKINEKSKDSGVVASIINNRLVLTDTNLGDSTISVKTTQTVLDAEGNVFSEDTGTDNPLAKVIGLGTDAELTYGQSAKFTINGIDVERNTNTIDDVVEGLTFKLTSIHKNDELETINVASDDKKTTEAVKEFVEQYNSIMDFLDKQLDVGDPSAEDNKTGALTGDGTVMRLQSGLRSLMTKNLEGEFSGNFKNIKDIGITIDRYGKATFDEGAFNDALQEDPTNVARFFYTQTTVTEEVTEDGEVPKSHIKREGMSELLKNFVDTYISTSSAAPGIITGKNKSFDRMLKDINEQIETFNARVDRKRDRYIKQFTALDTAMMQAQSQMDYLYSQLGMSQTNQQ